MANHLTPYALELGLNFTFTTAAVTRPAALYLARHVGSTNDSGSINEVTTATDTDYTRPVIPFDAAMWNSSLGLALSLNSSVLTLRPAVAAGTQSYYAWSIWDAPTGGNCLSVIPFAGYTISASNAAPVEIRAGAIALAIKVGAGRALTDTAAKMVLDCLFTSTTVTRPVAWKLSLHTADPGASGAANELTVGVDTDYVQKAVSFSAAATLVDTEIRNSTAALWIPAAGSVFDATHICVKDNATGNSLAVNALTAPKSSSASISVSENFIKIIMTK